jgi:hypothetical protein
MGDQSVARPLRTEKRTEISMEFEPTIPVYERAKTGHALGRKATVINRIAD